MLGIGWQEKKRQMKPEDSARRVQNQIQGGTDDVHSPHTPLPRLPHRFSAGVQQ